VDVVESKLEAYTNESSVNDVDDMPGIEEKV
jgi:hypothetical protein